jgi:hypothetical protein
MSAIHDLSAAEARWRSQAPLSPLDGVLQVARALEGLRPAQRPWPEH